MPFYEFTLPVTALEVYKVWADTPEEATKLLQEDPGEYYEETIPAVEVLQTQGEFSEPEEIYE
jgi:hypothetical protein